MEGAIVQPLDAKTPTTKYLGGGTHIGAATVVFLGLNLVLAVVATLADLWLAATVWLGRNGQVLLLRRVPAIEEWTHPIQDGQFALILITGAIYMKWMSDAVRRAWRRDRSFPHSLSWAQASFVVPIVNLYLPAKITNSLIHVAHGRVGSQRKGLHPVILAWWVPWKLAGLVNQASTIAYPHENANWDDYERLAWANTFSDLALIIAAAFAIAVVRQVAGLWTSAPVAASKAA